MHTNRTVIAGGPYTGKAGAAALLADGAPVRHTDDLITTHSWSEASAAAAGWLNDPGPWVFEGVAMVRALRKWMGANEGKPCDVLIWMREPRVDRTDGQNAMAKGCETVLGKILGDLQARGVVVRYE